MILSRDEFCAMMAAEGVEIEPGAPIWAYSEAHGIRHRWFVLVHEYPREWWTELAFDTVCYMESSRRGPFSWWGVDRHEDAMELLMRWG